MTSFSHRTAWSFGLAALLELFDGDSAGVAGLLEAASASISRDAAAIGAAATAGDRAALVELTHRLKGTSGTIDAGRILKVVARLEASGPDDGATLAALIPELQAAVAEVETDIAGYLRDI